MLKEEYILQINTLLCKCDDIALIDLIYQILNKSVQKAA